METKQSVSRQPSSAEATIVKAGKTVRPAARIGEGSRRRGFASMDPATQRRLAVEGGKASHSSGRGHKWTVEEARAAGRKGGLISRRKPSASSNE